MYSARRADLGHRVTSLRRRKGAVLLRESNVKTCTVAIHISESAFSKCIFQLKARNFYSRISHRGLNQSIFAQLPGANSRGDVQEGEGDNSPHEIFRNYPLLLI